LASNFEEEKAFKNHLFTYFVFSDEKNTTLSAQSVKIVLKQGCE
jgi:hypothetical protein